MCQLSGPSESGHLEDVVDQSDCLWPKCSLSLAYFFSLKGGKGTPGPKGDDGEPGDPGLDVSDFT